MFAFLYTPPIQILDLALPKLTSLSIRAEENDFCSTMTLVLEILRIAPNVLDLQVDGPCGVLSNNGILTETNKDQSLRTIGRR